MAEKYWNSHAESNKLADKALGQLGCSPLKKKKKNLTKYSPSSLSQEKKKSCKNNQGCITLSRAGFFKWLSATLSIKINRASLVHIEEPRKQGMVECFCIHLIHIFSAAQDVLVNIYLAKEGLEANVWILKEQLLN